MSGEIGTNEVPPMGKGPKLLVAAIVLAGLIALILSGLGVI